MRHSVLLVYNQLYTSLTELDLSYKYRKTETHIPLLVTKGKIQSISHKARAPGERRWRDGFLYEMERITSIKLAFRPISTPKGSPHLKTLLHHWAAISHAVRSWDMMTREGFDFKWMVALRLLCIRAVKGTKWQEQAVTPTFLSLLLLTWSGCMRKAVSIMMYLRSQGPRKQIRTSALSGMVLLCLFGPEGT